MEDEEDALLIKKAQKRLKNIDPNDLIPIEDAFKEAGWRQDKAPVKNASTLSAL